MIGLPGIFMQQLGIIVNLVRTVSMYGYTSYTYT